MYVKMNSESYYEKVNFIDEKDTFVGFSFSQDCCENFGYVFTDTDKFTSADRIEVDDNWVSTGQKINNESDFDLEDYFFDVSWFEEREQIVVLRLQKRDCPDLYLTLFNCHNGYYSHGFDFKLGEHIIHKSSI